MELIINRNIIGYLYGLLEFDKPSENKKLLYKMHSGVEVKNPQWCYSKFLMGESDFQQFVKILESHKEIRKIQYYGKSMYFLQTDCDELLSNCLENRGYIPQSGSSNISYIDSITATIYLIPHFNKVFHGFGTEK